MQFGAKLIGRYNIKHRDFSYRSRYLRFLEQIMHLSGFSDRPDRGLRSQSAAHCSAVPEKRNPAVRYGGMRKKSPKIGLGRRSLLPRPLLVAVRFQALSALVLVHLQTTFLFQIAHGG
jgi:hypothetical protein